MFCFDTEMVEENLVNQLSDPSIVSKPSVIPQSANNKNSLKYTTCVRTKLLVSGRHKRGTGIRIRREIYADDGQLSTKTFDVV